MAGRTGFDVLLAFDGSPQARAALAVAIAFPWPRASRGHGVVARGGFVAPQAAVEWPASVWSALDQSLERMRRVAARALARRWPGADVAIVDDPAVPGILARARRVSADVIVMGTRGHGLLGSLVMGSVSRGVVRRAGCPVLVVRSRRRRPVRHLLLGFDGSPNARRAVAFAARLAPPRGGRVTVLRVVEPVRPPAMALVPGSIKATIAAEAAELAEERQRAAEREIATAARELRQRGWRVRPLVRVGLPLDTLLGAVASEGADALVLGARGVGGVERLLLGSVAEGALSRAPVPLLLVK